MFPPFPPVCLPLALPKGKEGTFYYTSEGLLPMLGFNMMAVTILVKDMFPVSRSVRREGSYQEARAPPLQHMGSHMEKCLLLVSTGSYKFFSYRFISSKKF